MKRLSIFTLFLVFSFTLHSQPWMQEFEQRKTTGRISFYEIQSAFNRYMDEKGVDAGFYYEDGRKMKAPGWKQFKRWEYIWEPRADKEGFFASPTSQLKTYRGIKNSTRKFGDWSEIGPIQMPNNGTGQPNGLGRLNAVAFHPTDPDILFVAAPSGGMWKTSEGGLSWVSLTDTLPTLGTSSILVNPENPDEIYIGTGDRDAGDARGLGVWKTLDGGNSWSRVLKEDITAGMMVMHPENPDTIWAATSYGIYKTLDGGQLWNRKQTGNFKDIELKPDSPDTLYATASGEIYRSVNAGENWNKISTDFGSLANRCVIAVTPANPDYVYVVATRSSDSDPFMGLYRSTDNGSTFELRADSPNLLGYDADGGDPRSQAWYDLCIAADPKDAEVVYVGAINIWKSEDGGENWTINAHWLGTNAPAVHADQHDLVFSPVDGRLYSAHDGGVHYTSNGGANWNEITNGLAIAQVYKIGQSKQTKDLIMNGYQDNGTSVASGLDDFTTVIGGDGMECAIDHIDETYRYGSLYYGDIRRSTGSYYYSVRNESSQNGIDEDGGWVTPYKLDHQNPNIMYAGFKNIWRSENIKTTDVSDIEWEKLTNHTSGNIVDLEQSPADLNTLYYSKYASFYRIDNLQNGTMSIENLSSNLPITSTPTDILTHPDKKDVVYISIYKSVYRSDDRGQSWTDITGNLPDTYMNCLDLDTLSGGLFAGTYLGVYYRDTSTNEWVSYNKDFPAVDVRELEIFYDTEVPGNSSLRAATYGRGLWKSPLMTPAISDFRVVGKTHKDVTLGWSLNAFEDSVILAYSEDSIIGNLQDSVSYNRGDTIAGGGNILFVGNDSVSYIHKGLLPYTNYYYKIWTWHKGAYVSELAVIAKTEKIPAPRNFTITNIQKNNLDINWNLNEYGDSVLLLYSRQNVFEEPVQDSVYQTGQTLEGGGTLIYQGNASSFEHAGLKELAKYYYRIWSIKQGFYSDGITISGKTACETPATQVSGIAADVLTNNSISLTWNRGNGDKVLVVGRMGTQINNEPESGLVYSGNQIFGEGTSLGNNTYALYNGTGNELIIDSLDAYQDYSFAAYEYMEGNACYLIPGNQNSFKTQKNSLQFLVTDRESETPLYNAAVWVDTLQKNTDMQGLAEFELTNGSYEYVVEAENYLSDTGEFNIKNTNKTFRAPLSPIVTSVNEAEFNEDGIIVFPNPTTGLVNVITKQKQRDVHIKIVGVDGKLIYSRVFDYFSDIQIDLNAYPRGSYFVYVKTKQGVVVKLLIYRK